jgi:hypothetical protein
MKSVLWTFLLAAPLAATTTPPPTIIYNIVVTLVPAPGTPIPPAPVPFPVTLDPTLNPDPTDPTSPAPIVPIGCVIFYPDAVTALNSVYAMELQAQQLYASAYAAGGINAATYLQNINTLRATQLYTQDLRDAIRIGVLSTLLDPSFVNISTQLAAIPALLGNLPSLATPLPPLIATMQMGLDDANSLVDLSTCAESSP